MIPVSGRGRSVPYAYRLIVAFSTSPPSRSGNGGTSVPPPANEMRSGALARMIIRPQRSPRWGGGMAGVLVILGAIRSRAVTLRACMSLPGVRPDCRLRLDSAGRPHRVRRV